MQLNQIPHMPKAVIFDMDGLLLDSERIYGRVWEQAAVELGYSSSQEQYIAYVGRRAEDCDDDLRACFGADFPIARFWERQIELYNEHRLSVGIPRKPGVEELLAYLMQSGIRTAIATSTGREEALLSLGEIAERFDVIVTGDEVANGKPDPEIFLLAAERLSTPVRDCLVLEDSEAGLQAACSASIAVIMVPDLKPPSEQATSRATMICTSLLEVREILLNAEVPCGMSL